MGLVCARALLEHGLTHLAIFDVDDERGNAAMDHFRSFGNDQELSLLYLKVDVTDEKAVNIAVKDISTKFGGTDILLCFAGITGCQLAVDYNIDDWRKIMDVNVTGSFLVARAVARLGKPIPQIAVTFHYCLSQTITNTKTDLESRDIISRNSSGSIVLTASMSGYIVNQPQPQSAYAVSKAGVHHLTRSLAGEWVGHNIRVNSISPGIMNTRLSGGDAQAELRKLWMPLSPMGIGDPEDLTGPVILLCSPAGRFITGKDIVIDGKTASFADKANICGHTAESVTRWLYHFLMRTHPL